MDGDVIGPDHVLWENAKTVERKSTKIGFLKGNQKDAIFTSVGVDAWMVLDYFHQLVHQLGASLCPQLKCSPSPPEKKMRKLGVMK